jgi:NAD+ kinase
MIGTAGALQELPGHHHAPSRIGLVLHPERDATPVLETVRGWARLTGTTILSSADPSEREQRAAESELLLAVGGDATALEAVRLAAPRGIPVLGLNLGRLGELTEFEVRQLSRSLDALGRGDFGIESQTALTLHLGRGGPLLTFDDVVLSRSRGGSKAMVALHVDGDLISRQAGDGLMVSPRPTAVLVTPLDPHAAVSGSLVLSHADPIILKVLRHSAALTLQIDGRENIELPPESRLIVEAAPNVDRVVRLGAGHAARLRRR